MRLRPPAKPGRLLLLPPGTLVLRRLFCSPLDRVLAANATDHAVGFPGEFGHI